MKAEAALDHIRNVIKMKTIESNVELKEVLSVFVLFLFSVSFVVYFFLHWVIEKNEILVGNLPSICRSGGKRNLLPSTLKFLKKGKC